MPSMAGIIKKVFAEESKRLHCAFLAKVLTVSGNKAKIQPLGLVSYNGTNKAQAVITGVHIAESARYRIVAKEGEVAKLIPISKGDIVQCVCCDRNIDAALRGENSLPPAGYHNQTDCVIVAII